MRGVVKADGFERYSREMMGLEFGEELEFIAGMLRARVRDVLEVAGELVLGICSHFLPSLLLPSCGRRTEIERYREEDEDFHLGMCQSYILVSV